jgi:hypothetical protein
MRTKSVGSVRITACSKYEWNTEQVWAARPVADVSEVQVKSRLAV